MSKNPKKETSVLENLDEVEDLLEQEEHDDENTEELEVSKNRVDNGKKQFKTADKIESTIIASIEHEDAEKEINMRPDPEENLLKVVMKSLFSSTDLGKKTELTEVEIKLMSRALVLAEIYDCEPLKNYIIKRMELNLSKNRKSREELVKLAHLHRGESFGMPESAGASMFSRLFGG